MNSVTPSSSSVLILGGPSTGKTHYGAQLCGRLRKEGTSLSLRKTPECLEVFDSAMQRLNSGLSADHTPGNHFGQLVLPLQTCEGNQIDLVWPDYGGEQVKIMMEQRKVSPEWQARIQNAKGWLLFLRPGVVPEVRDAFNRPIEELGNHQPNTSDADQRTEQARLIEFLQVILHVRQADTIGRVRRPPLCVALSCWDEISVPDGNVPRAVLRNRLPLMADFVEATWESEASFVIGLSSTGRALDPHKPDEEYIDNGPENYGYVVGPTGVRNPDLTTPLAELIRRF